MTESVTIQVVRHLVFFFHFVFRIRTLSLLLSSLLVSILGSILSLILNTQLNVQLKVCVMARDKLNVRTSCWGCSSCEGGWMWWGHVAGATASLNCTEPCGLPAPRAWAGRSGSWCSSGSDRSWQCSALRPFPSAGEAPGADASRSGRWAPWTCLPSSAAGPAPPAHAAAPPPRPAPSGAGTAPGWPAGVHPVPCGLVRPWAPAGPGSLARRSPGSAPLAGDDCDPQNSASHRWWLGGEAWMDGWMNKLMDGWRDIMDG